MAIKVELEVIGEEKMHCSACETRVQFALSRVPGVQQVLASAKTQRIAIIINPAEITAQTLQTRLKDAGFETTLLPI